MIQKILSLGSKQFLGGIASSPYSEQTGLWEYLNGVDITRELGLIMSGYAATDIGGETVTDTVTRMVLDSVNSKSYALGDDNKFYSINSSDAPTYLSAVSATAVTDILVYKDNLIYPQATQVGRYGVLSSSPTPDNDGVSGASQLTSSTYHPLCAGPDKRVYVGDVTGLNSFSDVGTAPANDWTVDDLIIDSTYTITCLENDGFYLIIGATPTGSTLRSHRVKVYFWDTFTETYNREWTIPDSELYALKTVGDYTYAFCKDGVWKFNYDNAPVAVLHKGTGIATIQPYATLGGVDQWKGQAIWAAAGNIVTYGTPDSQRIPNFIGNPFTLGETFRAIMVKDYTNIYASTTVDKLYAFKSGYGQGLATTVDIDLQRFWKITGVKLSTSILVSGASVLVEVIRPQGGVVMFSDTISYTRDGAKAAFYIPLNSVTKGAGSNISDQVRIQLTTNGNVAIKRVDLLGEPMPETYV